MIATLRVVLQLAFRNLLAARLKTFIVGGIIFFGSLIVTVGGSLMDSVVTGMSRSIIGTLAGDIQVYSAKSKEDLALFGSMGGADADLAQIEEYETIKKTIEGVPNVAQIVPMGLSNALVTSGNTIDLVLEKLRNAVRKQLAGDHSPTIAADIESQKHHVQQIIHVLQAEQKTGEAVLDQRKVTQDDRDNAAALKRAGDPAFWAGFDRDELNALEFLENKIAPQTSDSDLLFMRYVGTDMDLYRKSFDRFHLVDGTTIPEGHRGFMFSKFFYEERLKLKTARRLDKIRTAILEKHEKIKDDPELQRMVRENQKETREVLLQLDAASSAKMATLLAQALAAPAAHTIAGADPALKTGTDNLGKLLGTFFATDDDNFLKRYDFFYAKLAPLLELYRIRVGDTLTIKAFAKTGYSRSVNLKVYGTFEFAGLDKSPLAGAVNLMDLVSFRDLYGFLTADSQKAVQDLKAAAGGRDIDRKSAEADLFGGGSGDQIVATAVSPAPEALQDTLPDLASATTKLHRDHSADRAYDLGELQRGVVLNAAVILNDHAKLDQTIADISAAAQRDHLDLKVVSWKDAAGLIGNLVLVFQVVLFVAVLVIFLVALVIINNALVMATLERVREIGTLRAVGAQRTFILGMLVIEAAVIGLVFGGLGAAAGSLIVLLLNATGIPATTDVLNFFFSGPALHPFVNVHYVLAAIGIVLLVSTLSSLYPAWLAMRISPRQAMGAEE